MQTLFLAWVGLRALLGNAGSLTNLVGRRLVSLKWLLLDELANRSWLKLTAMAKLDGGRFSVLLALRGGVLQGLVAVLNLFILRFVATVVVVLAYVCSTWTMLLWCLAARLNVVKRNWLRVGARTFVRRDLKKGMVLVSVLVRLWSIVMVVAVFIVVAVVLVLTRFRKCCWSIVSTL